MTRHSLSPKLHNQTVYAQLLATDQELRDAGDIRNQVSLLDAAKGNLLVAIISSFPLRNKSVAGQREFGQFAQECIKVQEPVIVCRARLSAQGHGTGHRVVRTFF